MASTLPDDSLVLKDKPSLFPGLDMYLQAYFELKSERQIGMAAGQIPWYSIIRWCKFHQFNDPLLVDKIVRFVRSLEYVEQEHVNKKEKANDRR